ncbi:hypothetical protein V8E36_008798 [Tilletia maclaganii]
MTPFPDHPSHVHRGLIGLGPRVQSSPSWKPQIIKVLDRPFRTRPGGDQPVHAHSPSSQSFKTRDQQGSPSIASLPIGHLTKALSSHPSSSSRSRASPSILLRTNTRAASRPSATTSGSIALDFSLTVSFPASRLLRIFPTAHHRTSHVPSRPSKPSRRRWRRRLLRPPLMLFLPRSRLGPARLRRFDLLRTTDGVKGHPRYDTRTVIAWVQTFRLGPDI